MIFATLRTREFNIRLFLFVQARRLHTDALVVKPAVASVATNHRSFSVVSGSADAIEFASFAQLFQFVFEMHR